MLLTFFLSILKFDEIFILHVPGGSDGLNGEEKRKVYIYLSSYLIWFHKELFHLILQSTDQESLALLTRPANKINSLSKHVFLFSFVFIF